MFLKCKSVYPKKINKQTILHILIVYKISYRNLEKNKSTLWWFTEWHPNRFQWRDSCTLFSLLDGIARVALGTSLSWWPSLLKRTWGELLTPACPNLCTSMNHWQKEHHLYLPLDIFLIYYTSITWVSEFTTGLKIQFQDILCHWRTWPLGIQTEVNSLAFIST